MPARKMKKGTAQRKRPSKGGRKAKGLESPSAMKDSPPVWEMYSRESAKRDENMIKGRDWGLNALLILASLFSALMSPLIAKSMKSLQEDPSKPSDIMVKVYRRLVGNQYRPG
ncbi:hypothetical protein CPB86DRAFT_872800 [Serendipita vermifera]|nr:hypothetical protein CPB86DRAFT_872800 [Serendipita vermifera]